MNYISRNLRSYLQIKELIINASKKVQPVVPDFTSFMFWFRPGFGLLTPSGYDTVVISATWMIWAASSSRRSWISYGASFDLLLPPALLFLSILFPPSLFLVESRKAFLLPMLQLPLSLADEVGFSLLALEAEWSNWRPWDSELMYNIPREQISWKRWERINFKGKIHQ